MVRDEKALMRIARAAARLASVAGELHGDDFEPLPHPSLSAFDRERIAAWLEAPWRELHAALRDAGFQRAPVSLAPLILERAICAEHGIGTLSDDEPEPRIYTPDMPRTARTEGP